MQGIFQFSVVCLTIALLSCASPKPSSVSNATDKSSNAAPISSTDHKNYYETEPVFVSNIGMDPISTVRGAVRYSKNPTTGAVEEGNQQVKLTYIVLAEDLPIFQKLGLDIQNIANQPFQIQPDPTKPQVIESQRFIGYRLNDKKAVEPFNFPIQTEVLVINGTSKASFSGIRTIDPTTQILHFPSTIKAYAYYMQSIVDHFTANPNSETVEFDNQGLWHCYAVLTPSFLGTTDINQIADVESYVGGITENPTALKKEATAVTPSFNPQTVIDGMVAKATDDNFQALGLNMSIGVGGSTREDQLSLPLVLVAVGGLYYSTAPAWNSTPALKALLDKLTLTWDESKKMSSHQCKSKDGNEWIFSNSIKYDKANAILSGYSNGVFVGDYSLNLDDSYQATILHAIQHTTIHEVGHAFQRRSYTYDKVGGTKINYEVRQLYIHCAEKTCALHANGLIPANNLGGLNLEVETCDNVSVSASLNPYIAKNYYQSRMVFRAVESNYCYQHYSIGPMFYLSSQLWFAGNRSFTLGGN